MADRRFGAKAGAATKRARWASQRALEVTREQGIQETARRGRTYLQHRRRGLASRPQLPPLPTGAASHWPDALVILAAPDIPQCYRYRVAQKQEMARAMGMPLLVADMRDPDEARSIIQLGSACIVYRQPWSMILDGLTGEARRLGQPVIFETDDLVYRRALLETNPNLLSVPADLRKAVIVGSDAYLNALRHADHVIASTDLLAQDMETEVKGKSFVIENGIDDEVLAVLEGIAVDPIVQPWLRQHADEVVITYGSGSRAHDSDLAEASEGIRVVMERHPNVWLKLIGPLMLPRDLEHLEDRVIRTEAVPYGDYLRDLAMSHITIAPLDDSPFNGFKSHVKYLEAGLLRLPLVASPTVYDRYVIDGQTALISRTARDWTDNLESLVTDPQRRQEIGDAAFQHVQAWRTDAIPGEQFAAFLREIMLIRRAAA